MMVLELGNYIVPAYAGMLLAEQGYRVEKWIRGDKDPIHGLRRGDELWSWINHGKILVERDFRTIESRLEEGDIDVVIENVRPSTWKALDLDPKDLAARYGVRWVAMRAEVGEVSFDALAQARSWLAFAPWVPFYIGDTAGGLWLAFKAICSPGTGYFELGHASVLQKLVEGELVVEEPRFGTPPWDTEGYSASAMGARVCYKGQEFIEPARDREWKLKHLWHSEGRIRI